MPTLPAADPAPVLLSQRSEFAVCSSYARLAQTKIRVTEQAPEPTVVACQVFGIDQQGETLVEAEIGDFGYSLLVLPGLCHHR